MAIITLQFPVSTFRGKTGTTGSAVLYPRGNRTISRAYAIPANPNTPLQAQIRSNVTTAAGEWQLTTPEERAAWAALALEMTRLDPDGVHYDPTGYGLFVGVNSTRYLDTRATEFTAPPAVRAPAIDDIIAIGYSILFDESVVTFSHSLPAGSFFQIRMSAPMPGAIRQARSIDCRMATNVVHRSIFIRTSSPQIFEIESGDQRLPFAIGNRVGVEITSFSPGFLKGRSLRSTLTVETP